MRRPPEGTVGAVLARAAERLAEAGVPGGRFEAALLVGGVLGLDRGAVLAAARDPLPEDAAERIEAGVARRVAREPLQHILGVWEFYGRELTCDARALVPRPETEGLIDVVLRLDVPTGGRIADLGTGSGCLAVTLAAERPDLTVAALDVSRDALALAGENARRVGVERRVELVACDLATPPPAWYGSMHVVVSNPPYVREDEWAGLEPEVRNWDPREALVAGPTGLEAYERLAAPAHGLLVGGGRVVLELGAGQSAAVRRILEAAGFRVEDVVPDLQGIPRVLVARREGRAPGAVEGGR